MSLGNRLELERDTVIVACAVSAGIHAALTPEHFDEGFGAGAGFLAAAVLLGGLVLALIWQPASIVAMGAACAALAGLLPATCSRPRPDSLCFMRSRSRSTASPWRRRRSRSSAWSPFCI
jgi:hypothetical protein